MFLCQRSRRGVYDPLLAEFGSRIVWEADALAMLVRAVLSPPVAVLVDVPSAIRCDKLVVSRLFDLQLDVPALRVQVRRDGSADAMCVDPIRQGELRTALREILAQDPRWRSTRFQRHRVRLPYRCRVVCRGGDDRRILRGNTMDVSAGGCFVICYEPFDVGTRLEVEFHDAGGARCSGYVAWLRAWDAGGLIPGMGIEFDRDDVVDVLGEELGAIIRGSTWPLTAE